MVRANEIRLKPFVPRSAQSRHLEKISRTFLAQPASSRLDTHKMAASQPVQAKLSFLFKASNTQFASCPELCNFYMQQFQKTAQDANVTLADAVQRLHCSHCGALFVAGVNCTVRVNTVGAQQRKKKAIAKRCRNTIQSTCHTCKHQTVLPGSTTAGLKTLGKPSLSKISSETSKSPALPVDAGKKKTKKKKLDLQAMIKQKSQPTNNASSFGLDDFLSSL